MLLASLAGCGHPVDVDCPRTWRAPPGTYHAIGIVKDIEGTAVITEDRIEMDYEDTDGNTWHAVFRRPLAPSDTDD
jgi:hypothetical protein